MRQDLFAQPRMRNPVKIISNFLITLFIVCLSSCHSPKPLPPAPSYPVQITKAKIQDVPIFIEALGHVESIISINIYSRIEGELIGVHFKQGQEVKQGDLLFTIDPKPYQAAVKQAQGALEQSLANLALAEEKVKRYRMLASNEYYSQIDYETLQSDLAANLALVKENQGRVDSANIELDYCWIYAPIDGMTGILQIDYGNLICVNCNSTLVTLNQMAPIFVTFNIPEFQLPRIQKSYREKTLKVLSAYEDFKSGDIFEGELYMLDNTVDEQTGMIAMRGIFENKNRELWPGQFVRNRLILYTMKDAVIIPFTAVQITQTGPIIFILKEDMTVEQRSVKLGQRMDENVIVLQGIEGGEKIIFEGQINLHTGSKVRITGTRQ